MRLDAPGVHGEPPSGLSGATKRKAATGLTEQELKVCWVLSLHFAFKDHCLLHINLVA